MEEKSMDMEGKEGEENMDCDWLLELPLGECMSTFNLEKAVCNHGFFMMAPNLWIPSTKTFQRPLRLADSTTSITVSVSHPPNHASLLIRVHGTDYVSSPNKQAILAQVGRMLRISGKDERDVREFQTVHPEAKKKGFGRIFRSPTLFEDAIKSMLLCNCTWVRTLSMARALCELQSELTSGSISHLLEPNGEEFISNSSTRKGLKRKRATKIPRETIKCTKARSNSQLSEGKVRLLGNFPSSKELTSLNEDILKERCNLGYRARHILKLAKGIESGKLQLKKFEQVYDKASYEKVYDKLLKIKGFGPFACANVLMCIGFYQKVPADTETIRHLQKIHEKESCSKGTILEDIKEIYEKYAPFQCLAYWLELCDFYENKFGKLSELPNSCYHTVTGSFETSRSKSK